nr:MAG TPA: hypothetical protein [Caudoviricetes sp.]
MHKPLGRAVASQRFVGVIQIYAKVIILRVSEPSSSQVSLSNGDKLNMRQSHEKLRTRVLLLSSGLKKGPQTRRSQYRYHDGDCKFQGVRHQLASPEMQTKGRRPAVVFQIRLVRR